MSEERLGDAVSLQSVRDVRFSTSGNFRGVGDSYTILVGLDGTCAGHVGQVRAIGPDACRFLVIIPEAAVVEAEGSERSHTHQVLHGGLVWVLNIPLVGGEIINNLQHLLDILAVFLAGVVQFLPRPELAVRADVGGLELRIDLTLGAGPDDLEVFGGILSVVKVEDVTHVGGIELSQDVQTHHLVTRLFHDFGDASGALEKLQDAHSTVADGFNQGMGAGVGGARFESPFVRVPLCDPLGHLGVCPWSAPSPCHFLGTPGGERE